MNVLHVCASPRPIEQSASKQLAAAFFTRLAEKNDDVNVTNVDLYNNPPPYLTLDAYRALMQPAFQPGYEPTDAEKKASNYSRSQSKLLKETDVLVLTMPMWNGGMPAIMKAWIDQAIVPNEIYTLDAAGAHPLHQLKRVILLISSGGVFKESDPNDGLTPQINAIMNFISVPDVAAAWADGQDPIMHHDGELRKTMAIEAAQELAEDVAEMT